MKKGTSFFLFVLIGTTVFGQAKFYATLNTKSIPVNQNFQLNFTVENGEGKSLRVPNLNDFQVLSGPNTSQSMQWVNGNMSQSVSYSFILRPKKEGTFKIGKATINISGANVESNELSITVTAPAQQQQVQQRRGWDPFEDPFGNDPFDAFNQQQEEEPQQAKQASGDLEKQIRDNVFVKMVTSKSSVYEGEQLTATLKLYYRLNFGNVQMAKAPKFDGFWSQEAEANPNPRPQVETINGQQFYVVEIQKYNLFPQRSGALQISATELNMIVQAQIQNKNRNGWSSFFGGAQVQNLPYKPVSNAVTVNVKELPENGKPKDFSGAVGQFNFEAKLSSKEAKTDEAITYTVKINGTGNLKTFELPKPIVPDGFEVYDPKTKEDIKSGNTGSKQADYLMIPRQPGEFTIEPLSFSYFDPSAGKYIQFKSPEYAVKVSGEPSKATIANNEIIPSADKSEVKELGKDIRFIKTKADIEPPFNFVGSSLQYGLMATPFLLFIAAFAYKRNTDKQQSDVMGTKLRRANKMAKKRLAVAEKHLKKNDSKAFYDEVSRALLGYVSDKLHIDAADLSKDNIEERLTNRGVNGERITSFKKALETCEFALYTNMSSTENMQQQYVSAVNLISELDGELKNA